MIALVLISPITVLSDRALHGSNHSNASEIISYLPSDVSYNSSVVILSDTDFVMQNWPGNGSESSPYSISNLRFSPDEDSIIRIYNTRAHFLLNNCVFESQDSYPWPSYGAGVILFNVSNGVIENCSINGKNTGLGITNINNTLIRNNLIKRCDHAIDMYQISNCAFSNNSIFSHDYSTGISGGRISYSNFTANILVEGFTGLSLGPNSINNTLTLNRIGWCTEANAKDFGSGNTWEGNSWSDWDGVSPYLISGSAGSVDVSPILFDEDVIAPTIEFYRYNGVVADSLHPIYSFTFVVNVSDATGVDSVSLFINNGFLIEDGKLVQSFWTEYNMDYQPIEGNLRRYSYTFSCNGSFSATYYYWANDTLGYSRRSEIDSFSISPFPWGTWSPDNTPSLGPEYLLLLPIGALVLVWLVRRLKPIDKP
ncbi:MAG: NosD domain-containing protein [Candidatus Thorarchaeota archaeon]